MNKIKEKNAKEVYTEDEKLSNKILDLCLLYQIEESNLIIKMISHQIDFCNLQKEHLLDNKPFWFQKEKLIKWKKELDEIDNKMFKYYEDVGNEINMIDKMKKSIDSKEDKKINVKDEKISFYDLLVLLKEQIIPKKLLLKIGNKEETYIFDGESSYVLEDESVADNIFEYYLSDSLSNFKKLEKNIVIIK